MLAERFIRAGHVSRRNEPTPSRGRSSQEGTGSAQGHSHWADHNPWTAENCQKGEQQCGDSERRE